ncbi:MAG: hypothetical protein VB050_14725, partial [Geobacteraceae bacterium]|nr:hypothetical protein [Geobacteraceae bacterium]
GYFIADDDGRTTKPGVFAGGDIVTGAATVILAIGAGKKAARAMHDYLMGSVRKKEAASCETNENKVSAAAVQPADPGGIGAYPGA